MSKTGKWCSYQKAVVGDGDVRRKKSMTGEDCSYHRAQVGPANIRSKGMDLISNTFWIEIGAKKRTIFFKQGMSSLDLYYGNHISSIKRSDKLRMM